MATDPLAEGDEEFAPLEFPETPERAREYLRLTLAGLARHGLAPTPLNYSLLYAYESGYNQTLREAFDQTVAPDGSVSREQIRTLFRSHVFSCEKRLLERYRDQLLEVVAQTLGSVTDFADETAVASQSLEGFAERLTGCANLTEMLQIVPDLVTEARSLAAKARRLEQSLASQVDEVSHLRAELRRVRQEAQTDALTGLLNRRAFDQVVEELLERTAHGLPIITLLLLDLDHFKQVNDTYGHLVGDQVLRTVGELLLKTVKGRDRVARVGGEEFAILLPDTLVSGGRSVAEDIRKRVQALRYRRSDAMGTGTGITVSIGLAAYHRGETWAELYGRCDDALYQAKRLGRNRVCQAD